MFTQVALVTFIIQLVENMGFYYFGKKKAIDKCNNKSEEQKLLPTLNECMVMIFWMIIVALVTAYMVDYLQKRKQTS